MRRLYYAVWIGCLHHDAAEKRCHFQSLSISCDVIVLRFMCTSQESRNFHSTRAKVMCARTDKPTSSQQFLLVVSFQI